MKIAVIGAKGNLGKRVTREALNRGHQVKAIIRSTGELPEGVEICLKDLFALTREDLAEMDVVISTYGSGFQVDPKVNREAFDKLIELLQGTGKKLIAIGGSGCLFTDKSHTRRVYELPEHPDFLRGISENTTLGQEDMKKAENLDWTMVSPGLQFDPEGPKTGKYLTGTEEEVLYNKDGESYTTYDDLAGAMLDIAEQGSFSGEVVTVVTEKK